MLQRRPTISLCMIAKDEQAWIEQCLRSVQDLVSEIVLVDTGSADATVEIARSFGARVYVRAWDEDFSAPRNLSIEIAHGDWILVLDADEALDRSDHAEIRRLVTDPSCCYEFTQRHYSNNLQMSGYIPARGEYREWERNYGGYFESSLVRLFPNNEGIHYRGRIHELVEHSIRSLNRHKIMRALAPIHHYGHTPEVQQRKNKGSLYRPLGAAKIKDNPHYWQSYFELAVERNCSGKREESVPAFLKAIELNPKYVPSWVNLGYVLCELKRYQDARQALETAIQLDPCCDEAYCNLGVVFMRTAQYKNAIACFEIAIQKNNRYVNAYCNLGKTYLLMNEISSAETVYLNALKVMPSCVLAKSELGAVYLLQGRHAQAEEVLVQALSEDDKLSKAHYYLGKVYQELARAQDALSALERFCAIEQERQNSGQAGEGAEVLKAVQMECRTMRLTAGQNSQTALPQPPSSKSAERVPRRA